MAADRLRPQAEGAAALAPTPGVEGDIGVALIAAEIFGGVEVALVDGRDHRQHVHVLDLRTVPVAHDAAIGRTPGDAVHLGERPALRQLDHREVIFLAADEIDRGAGEKTLFVLDHHLGADKADPDRGVALLDESGGADVLVEGRRRGVKDDEIALVELVRDVLP